MRVYPQNLQDCIHLLGEIGPLLRQMGFEKGHDPEKCFCAVCHGGRVIAVARDQLLREAPTEGKK